MCQKSSLHDNQFIPRVPKDYYEEKSIDLYFQASLCHLRPATLLKQRQWQRKLREISKNTFSYRTPPVAASEVNRKKQERTFS